MARQQFGGDWTEDKLQCVAAYLRSYNIALKKQPFTREYIDAFAGTGYRERRDDLQGGGLLFPELSEPDVQRFLDGSARIALNVEPAFHRFTFIESDLGKVRELEKLRDEFSDKDIRVVSGDANEQVQAICSENWRSRRAVLFLDPFGMQVSWQTLEAVARTRSIDVWLLFPLGTINRLLRKDGKMPDSWNQRLDFVFGCSEWWEALYGATVHGDLGQRGLFEDDAKLSGPLKAGFTAIEDFYRCRLKRIFAGVATESVRLVNSKNVPLYSLYFMVGNEAAVRPALNIAESIIKRWRTRN